MLLSFLTAFVAESASAKAYKFVGPQEIEQKINDVFELPRERRPLLAEIRIAHNIRVDLLNKKSLCQLFIEDEKAAHHYSSTENGFLRGELKAHSYKKVYLIAEKKAAKGNQPLSQHLVVNHQLNGKNVLLRNNGEFRLIASKQIGSKEFLLFEGPLDIKESKNLDFLFLDGISCRKKSSNWGFFQ